MEDSSARKRRKIVQLLAGDGRGGADRLALNLGEGLRERGHEIVFAVSPAFLAYHDLRGQGFPVCEIDRFRGISTAAIRTLRAAADDADCVLTHDSGARHLALMAKVRGLKPPLWFFRHCISGTSRWGGTLLHRWLVQRQLAISDAVAESLCHGGFSAKQVLRLPPGRDLHPFFQPDPAAVEAMRNGLLDGAAASGKLVIGVVARFSWYPQWHPDRPDPKGFDVLFRALARCVFPYQILICGPEPGRDQETLQALANHHGVASENLVFAGFQRDMTALYPLMDINVLPSRNEGLGLSLIEGLAAGVPAVASRGGGMVEIVEAELSGLLFPEGDADALAEALTRLAGDAALRRRLGAQGQRHALAKFNLAAMLDSFEAGMDHFLRPRHPALTAQARRLF